MTPERAVHAEIKLAVHLALVAAIRRRNLPCHVLPDGMTVRINESTAYEPDASVYCGPKLRPSALEVDISRAPAVDAAAGLALRFVW